MKLIQNLLSTALLLSSVGAFADPAIKEMKVYRSPTCGCCGKWEGHAKQSQFDLNDNVTDDMDAIKKRLGVPEKLASCHTAIVGGYVIEGHVPAADIEKLLATKPNIVGIAAPGMPLGSPGMEMAGKADAYQVVSFDKDGNIAVFAQH